ncbi:2,3-diketo-5-methylthiopentyl-1-phosphate enolase [filamentous cyanobacterium LEGE 11480]|uniref:2,3-diketo-5-methylthiopentyl-1-phosphate enolase n=1 Tax=Romeriopsis navalis LEGE 11480 TaxID=2777977 RepID=A0A928Z2U8_9CYAN|nr:RuBisCO large subunit C-terminal-like domain-containing protein [Romeriopsis navalis]MBE9029929.1 2,3-diketo-5-methylthiopentyl-1-phosphate enolase [Romeriopsis navalis LEGE 11480]
MSIEVDYRFPAGAHAEKLAKVIAVGQTVGSWDERWAEREASFRERLGQVTAIQTQDDGRNVATIAFPEANVEGDIASLLTMIFGKFSMAGVGKVIAVRLPLDYGTQPKFGISGIRSMLGLDDRPLVMAIFKPALGLSAADHAKIMAAVAPQGLDIIKDDEIMANLDSAPTMERLKACREVIDRTQDQTGKPLLYAVNVTGRADELITKARKLVAQGANALLLNVLTYGFSVLEALARDPEINVPIFAHPALAGAMCGAPNHGLSYRVVLGTLMAHAGADAVLYPAHYGSLPFEPAAEFAIRDALRDRNVFPVPSAGIHPGIVPMALRDYGQDVILNAGTGIMDHPQGAGAGVQAFFAALAQAQPGQKFVLENIGDGPLRSALEKWGVGE